MIAAAAIAACVAVDGDTLRCGEQRIRLLGVDAPEMPGHCRRGRQCAPGDPDHSKIILADMINGHALEIDPVTTDRYGRTVAIVRINGRNLSCKLLAKGAAVYVERYDTWGLIAKECGVNARRP